MPLYHYKSIIISNASSKTQMGKDCFIGLKIKALGIKLNL